MKLIVKKFKGAVLIRVEGCTVEEADKIEASARRSLKGRCQSVTVNTFDAPPPVCGPDEKNCG